MVVTNGAIQIDTRGGDDLVCVTESAGRYPELDLVTGAGDDVVDASASRGPMAASSGAGSDHYTGSARGGDWVVAGDGGVDTEPDTDPHGRRRAGRLGRLGVTGRAQRRRGRGRAGRQHRLLVRPDDGGARLDATAGPGSTLVPDLGTGHAVVDATAGTLTRDGFVTLRWTGFDDFGFSGTAAPRAFRFDGSDRDESVYVSFPTEASADSAATSAAVTTPCSRPTGRRVEEQVRRRGRATTTSTCGPARGSTSTWPRAGCGCARTAAR